MKPILARPARQCKPNPPAAKQARTEALIDRALAVVRNGHVILAHEIDPLVHKAAAAVTARPETECVTSARPTPNLR